jgi:hypothetical protein
MSSRWINLPDNYLDDELLFGIVYIIKNNHPDSIKKYYIGQKQAKKKIRRPPLKGKKAKRICYVDNNLEEYWGSSSELHDDMEKYGEQYFTKEVLHCCCCKWELNYMETMEQFKYNVLLDETCYNGIINVRIGNVPKAVQTKYDKDYTSIRF